MSIDPKKGGQCWSCKFCEDVATQTNNPSGSYYRKCNKSGHEYIDTCRFHCSDYVWDGKTEEYHKSSTTYSGSSSTSSGSTNPTYSAPSDPTTPSSSSTKNSGFLPWALLILVLLVYIICYVAFYTAPNDTEPEPVPTTLSTTLATTPPPTEPDLPVAYVDIPDALNLRIGPGSAYDIITTMPNGEKVYVQETRSGWSYVIYQGQSGWCSTEYLRFSE